MRKINRFYLIYLFYNLSMAYCVFLSNNAYINITIIVVAFLASLFAFGYVLDNMNDKEKAYTQKIIKFLSNEQ